MYFDTSVVMDTQWDDGPISYISHNTLLLAMDLILYLPNTMRMLGFRPCDGLQLYTWYTKLVIVSPSLL